MTSVCNIFRQQKKDFKDDSVEDEDDGAGGGMESTDFNPTRFLTVTHNETSISENISPVIKNPPIMHYAMSEGNYKKSKNRWPRRCQWLATPATSVQPKHGRTKEAVYCCTFCDKCFAKNDLLKCHMRLHTANISTEMSEALDEKSELKEEVDKVSYICEKCGMDCQCVSAYMQHQKIHKKKEKKLLSCHICRKEFKFNSLLLHHVERHKPKNKVGKSLSCLTCGKKYIKTGSLTKHELQHEGKGSFRCRPCGKVFSTEAERTKHRDEKHEKPWKCTVCSHMFASEQKLDAHVKWHESKEAEVFVCNVCDKEFKLKVNLKVHVESRCENHDWISPVFSSSNKPVEQPVTDDRFCHIADLHLASMERNIRRCSIYLMLGIVRLGKVM
ncbi:hypothetical protein Cfor_02948 [Coptotermes formosanus]|uniref:C2H2-type domain-containing protein n=1 Tax=Coptotermes formosanus TaxID=36987 RepID=A0A6L2QAD0_COPFO|nr:hypothetical protein Cfor_02948 [Coptotermes formosanus]